MLVLVWSVIECVVTMRAVIMVRICERNITEFQLFPITNFCFFLSFTLSLSLSLSLSLLITFLPHSLFFLSLLDFFLLPGLKTSLQIRFFLFCICTFYFCALGIILLLCPLIHLLYYFSSTPSFTTSFPFSSFSSSSTSCSSLAVV